MGVLPRRRIPHYDAVTLCPALDYGSLSHLFYQSTWHLSRFAEGNKGIGNGAQRNQIQKGNMVSGVRTIRVLGRSVSCTAMQSEDLDCRAHGPEMESPCVYVCVPALRPRGGFSGTEGLGRLALG